MTQEQWQEAVANYLDEWGFHPSIIAEVTARQDKGANSGRGLPPDDLDFLQDSLEEAMDGLCYCIGDLVERGCRLHEDNTLLMWVGLMGKLAAKRTRRRAEA